MSALDFTPWLSIGLLYVRVLSAAAIARAILAYRAYRQERSGHDGFAIPANDCCAP